MTINKFLQFRLTHKLCQTETPAESASWMRREGISCHFTPLFTQRVEWRWSNLQEKARSSASAWSSYYWKSYADFLYNSLNNLLQEEGLYIIGKDFAKATGYLGDILVKPFRAHYAVLFIASLATGSNSLKTLSFSTLQQETTDDE